MKRLHTSILSVSAFLAGVALSTGAMAQSTWNLYSGSGNGCSQNAGNSGDYGNSWSCTGSSGAAATASSWSADRGTTPVSPYSQSEIDYLNAPASGSYYASAYMADYGNSGFGSASRTEGIGATSPNHSFDSTSPGTQDLMLLDFGSASVILNQIGIGWSSGDSDITLLRWTGSVAPTQVNTSSLRTTDGQQNLIATGWSLVGSYSNLVADSSAPFGSTATNTGATQASSWWLISTFNSALNGGTSCKKADGTSTTCTDSDDAFKLNFISATVVTPPPSGRVPEPGSLALAGIALAGLFGVRRGAAKRT